VTFGLGGGALVPRHAPAGRSLPTGAHAQGFVTVALPAGLPALRFNVGFGRQRFAGAPGATGTAAALEGTRTLLSGVAGAKVDLLRGPVRPYVVAGLGAFDVREVAGARAADAVNFGLDGGAGLSVRVGRVRAFGEARVQNVYTRGGGLIDARTVQAVPVTFGLTF
jgi:hypothetical protein